MLLTANTLKILQKASTLIFKQRGHRLLHVSSVHKYAFGQLNHECFML